MKQWKRLLCLNLVLIMVLAMLPAGVLAEEPEGFTGETHAVVFPETARKVELGSNIIEYTCSVLLIVSDGLGMDHTMCEDMPMSHDAWEAIPSGQAALCVVKLTDGELTDILETAHSYPEDTLTIDWQGVSDPAQLDCDGDTVYVLQKETEYGTYDYEVHQGPADFYAPDAAVVLTGVQYLTDDEDTVEILFGKVMEEEEEVTEVTLTFREDEYTTVQKTYKVGEAVDYFPRENSAGVAFWVSLETSPNTYLLPGDVVTADMPTEYYLVGYLGANARFGRLHDGDKIYVSPFAVKGSETVQLVMGIPDECWFVAGSAITGLRYGEGEDAVILPLDTDTSYFANTSGTDVIDLYVEREAVGEDDVVIYGYSGSMTGKTADGKTWFARNRDEGVPATDVFTPQTAGFSSDPGRTWAEYEPGDYIYSWDHSLFAVYDSISVTYHWNYEGAPEAVTRNYRIGSYLSLHGVSRSLYRYGYELVGWNTKADGSGETVADGTKVSSAYQNLYAQWKKLDKDDRAWLRFHEDSSDTEGTMRIINSFTTSASSLLLYHSPYESDNQHYLTGFLGERGIRYDLNADVNDIAADGEIVDLTAQWQNYRGIQIVYYGNGNEGTAYRVQNVDEDGKVTLLGSDAFTYADGDQVVGWLSADGGKLYHPGETITADQSLVLYAERAFARLYFDWNDGKENSLSAQTYYYDQAIQKTLVRPDAIFVGWNSKADGSGNWYSPYDKVSAVKEAVLYAQWEKFPEEDYLILKSTTSGYSFDGAYRKIVDAGEPFPAEVTGGKVFAWRGIYHSEYYGQEYTDTYLPGETWDSTSKVKEFVLTPYVQGDDNLYGVLKGNGGLNENYRQQIPLVKVSTATSPGALRPYLNDYGYFYKDGYAHVGYTDESGNAVDFFSKTEDALQAAGAPQSVAKLYAQWEKLDVEPGSDYILYMGNDGVTPTGKTYAVSTDQIAIENPFNFAKKFLGWNTDCGGNGLWYQPGDTVSRTGYGKMLYAQWGVNRITFHDRKKDFTNIYWTSGNLPTMSSYDDQFFCGWNSEPDGSGDWYPHGAAVTSEMPGDLYAVWFDASKLEKNQVLLHSGIEILSEEHGQVRIMELDENSQITLPETSGYGWTTPYYYSDKTLTHREMTYGDSFGDGVMVKAGTTVTVEGGTYIWAVTSSAVVYHGNGGVSAEDAEQEERVVLIFASYVNLQLLGEDSFTKDGIKLKSWNTEPDGSGKDYAPGSTAQFNKTTHLYAQWENKGMDLLESLLQQGSLGGAVNPYHDVAATDWFYDAVQYVTDQGLMTGVAEGQFRPLSTMTRAMLAQVLYNMEGRPGSGQADFYDVTPRDWHFDAVTWAAEQGLVDGYPGGGYGPNDPVTREQIAVILYRYAVWKEGVSAAGASALSGFADAGSISSYAQEAMAWAVTEGIIGGVSDTALAPGAKATRAQIATMLMRFMEGNV